LDLALARRLAPAVLALGLVGCASPQRQEIRSAPDLAPPPLRGDPPVSREEALRILDESPDVESGILALDNRRLGFALDAGTIEWFRAHGAPSEAVDYLRKRAAVPWEGLRGDVDPYSPEKVEYVDPRRSDEDFAGKDARELFTSLRSLNPFQTEARPPVQDDFGR
jgi:hypothetical protein